MASTAVAAQVERFLDDATCDELVAAAAANVNLLRSRVGGASGYSAAAAADVRTSRSLAITQGVAASSPELQSCLRKLLDAASKLLLVRAACWWCALLAWRGPGRGRG
jgi:hypothetical protein